MRGFIKYKRIYKRMSEGKYKRMSEELQMFQTFRDCTGPVNNEFTVSFQEPKNLDYRFSI